MIDLKITTLNAVINVKSTKDNLIKCEYFNSLFTDNYEETNNINIDLTKFVYDNIDEYVTILFECINDPKIIKNVNFEVDIMKLIELSAYFGAEFMLKVVDGAIDKYSKYMISVSDEKMYATILRKVFDRQVQYEKFVMYILGIYDIYNVMGKMENFKELCDVVSSYNTKATINLDTNIVPLYKCFDISSLIPNKCTNLIQNIFEHYDKLTYTKLQPSEYQYKVYKNVDIEPKTNYGINAIVTHDEFIEKFNLYTNNFFVDMDWSNIVIAGGFIFGLLNNVSESIIESTDIDIFVYSNDENVRRAKWEYLMEFFSKYNPCYANKKGIINIISKEMKYDIQIIVMDEITPKDIIDRFDYNYIKLYYDGLNVYSHIECMFGFKYQLASCSLMYSKKFDERIYKTILKGLQIIQNEDIDKYCILFDKNKNLDIKLCNYNYDSVRKYLENNDIVNGEKYKDDIILTSDWKGFEWNNMCGAFTTYKGGFECQHILLNENNVNVSKELHKTANTVYDMKVYNHKIDNKLLNIFVGLKYNFIKFYKKHDYSKNTLFIYPNKETVDLLIEYGLSIGIDTFDTMDENYNDVDDTVRSMRDNMNSKLKIIVLNLDDTNHIEKKYIDKFLKYYKIKGLKDGANVHDKIIDIVCNVEWLEMKNRGVHGARKWYCLKFILSKIKFNI
jgi:hypothetical protein